MKFVFLQEIERYIKIMVKPSQNIEILQGKEGFQPSYFESIGTSVVREFAQDLKSCPTTSLANVRMGGFQKILGLKP